MIFDGFWLPATLREKALAGATWETHWLEGGAIRPDPADRLDPTPGAVGIRWPRLSPEQWRALAAGLREGRTVGGREVVERWQTVLSAARSRLAQEAATTIPTLAAATGYSAPMLLSALLEGDLVSSHLFASALEFQPTRSAARRWQRMPGLAGQGALLPGLAPVATRPSRSDLVGDLRSPSPRGASVPAGPRRRPGAGIRSRQRAWHRALDRSARRPGQLWLRGRYAVAGSAGAQQPPRAALCAVGALGGRSAGPGAGGRAGRYDLGLRGRGESNERSWHTPG